jgi:hypothetical protein
MIPSNQRASASDAQAGISGHRSASDARARKEIHLTCTLSAQGIRILIVRTKPDIICCTPAQNLYRHMLHAYSRGFAQSMFAKNSRCQTWGTVRSRGRCNDSGTASRRNDIMSATSWSTTPTVENLERPAHAMRPQVLHLAM